MRVCALCRTPDRLHMLVTESCTCGAPLAEFSPDAEHREGICRRVGHFVVDYIHPTPLRARDLVKKPESAGHGYDLTPALKAKGWRLTERLDRELRPVTGQWVRMIALCRVCLVEQVHRERRIAEREKLLKKMTERTKGKAESWSDLISSQDAL